MLLVVDKIHPKNKNGYTVSMRVETKFENGMRTTVWASMKWDKKPTKVGVSMVVNDVVISQNATGYKWIDEVR